MAWTASLAEPTLKKLEVRMDVNAHVTIEVRGEAHGAVGPGWGADPRKWRD